MAKKKAKLDFIEDASSQGSREDVANLAAEASEALSALLDTPSRSKKKSKKTEAPLAPEASDEAILDDASIAEMIASADDTEALQAEGLEIQEETDSTEESLSASAEANEAAEEELVASGVQMATADDEILEESAASAEADVESEMAASSDDGSAEENEESGESDELSEFGTTNIFTEEEPASFLPEASDDAVEASESETIESVEGTELDAFESAQIEEVEFVEEEQLDSIVESVLFASDRPVSLNSLKLVFKGTNIRGDKIKRALERLAVELASGKRGVSLEEVPGGYQLRTKVDNLQFLTRTLKARQFKLSGPALEVLAIVAYKQPLIKHEIDEIRGVESGHLLRALMEKGLVSFEGKSDLPGKPMLYSTTKKFLEIFGLRNLKELPTLSQIDELLPEGMTEEEAKPTLSQVTDAMSQTIGSSYSEGEDELMKITDQLGSINSSSDFFEQEKDRQRMKRDAERAQNIREAIAMDEQVPTRDRNWLAKYDEAAANGTLAEFGKPQPPAFMANKKAKASFDGEGESESEESGEGEALAGLADGGLSEDLATAQAGDEASMQDATLLESEDAAEEPAMSIEMQLTDDLDIEAIEGDAEMAFVENEMTAQADANEGIEGDGEDSESGEPTGEAHL
jgi:segregation and condensation protein B